LPDHFAHHAAHQSDELRATEINKNPLFTVLNGVYRYFENVSKLFKQEGILNAYLGSEQPIEYNSSASRLCFRREAAR
jgi:hypothetical protein